MKFQWQAAICALALVIGVAAVAQDNSGNSSDSHRPVLVTRPAGHDSTQQAPVLPAPSPAPVYAAPPNAIPEGTRFIVKLKDTLDTRELNRSKHFKAELREDLVTPGGLIIPKGRTIKGHVGNYERGFTGARIQLALDEIETRHGWVPLIATVTGVPGDHSIKSTENEGELTRPGPSKKHVLTNAAIGAGVGAITGSAIGGTKGAAIGAISGAGLGSGASLLMRGNDIRLDKETQLEVRLDRDLTVPSH